MSRRAVVLLLAVQFVISFTIAPITSWSIIPPANAQEAGSTTPSTGGTDLNLASTDKSVSAASVLQSATQATINLGSTTRTVGVNDMLTPAEMVAVTQVVNTGRQFLQLNDLGAAVGGGLRLNYYATNGISNLVIPENVRASQNAALLQSLNVTGNLTNAGTFNVYSSNAAINAATLNATNVYNNAGAVINSTLANLNINALHDIVNAGSILSSGNLNLTAGNSIINSGSAATMAVMQANNINMVANNIVNSGTIAAMTGNINIASQMTQNLTVNNIGGILQAFNGNINLRDSSYNGSANIDLIGGDILSKELNLYAGTGTAIVNVSELTGLVNISAGSEHISANTSLLQLGNNISSDPTYYNTGSIIIVGTVSSNEGLAIVAGGDITASASGQIVTNGNSLLMIAGANITSPCTGCSTPGPGTIGPTSGGTPASGLAEGAVTVSLTGGSGGNIDLSGSTAAKVIDTSSTTSAGGSVTLVALADLFGSKGQVLTNRGANLGEIDSSGSGAGGGGDVTIYAGSSFLGLVTSISTNTIKTVSSGTSNSGIVTLQTTQAVTSDGLALAIDAHGKITSGNTIIPGAALAQAGISTGALNTQVAGGAAAAGNVTVKAYGNIDTSLGDIATINNGTGASGEIVLTSTNGSISTKGLYSFVYGGWLAASNITLSAYGDINTNGSFIYAFQGGSGAGGTVTLTSSNGSITTGLTGFIVTGVGNTVSAGNVIVSAYGNVSLSLIGAFNAGVGGGGSVTVTSSNGSISTGEIATNSNLGLVAAGNVTLSALGNITVLGSIDASNSGSGMGGAVTLLTQGALTTGDINTSSTNLLGGSITAAASGDNGTYSIAMGKLNTSGAVAAGSVEIVSTNSGQKSTLIGTITTQASGANGAGGSIGIATRGSLAVGNIDTTNTAAVAGAGARSGSVFLSSGNGVIDAILAGSINAYNSANGSATGQVILIASGTITAGTITTAAGNNSVNAIYGSLTTSINSSTTIDVSVAGISNIFSNYNPQGYTSMSGGGTVLTINSGGNSSLLVPLLCLGTVSIDSINSNSSTQADGVALAAFGNITLSGTTGINTAGTTSGGNASLLSISGQITLGGSIATNSSGAGAAGNVNASAFGLNIIAGSVNASNTGTGAGGSVALISGSSFVSVDEIDTFVSGGAQAAGGVRILAYAGVNTNNNAIKAYNAGTGIGGSVALLSSNNSVATGTIETYASGGSAEAGSVFIAAFGSISTNGSAISTYHGNTGASGPVMLVSSNSTISTGAINNYVNGGSLTAADITLSAYGNITVSGAIDAHNSGTGAGSTINLLSATGSVTAGSINVNVNAASIVAGNVNIEAHLAIDTSAGNIQATNGATRPIDSGVTLLSHTSSVTTGAINISVTGGSAIAGDVSISAPGAITINGAINASNAGTGSGGSVTLESITSTVTFNAVDTHVNSNSATAGTVSVSAYGSVSTSGTINAYNTGAGLGGAGAAGTVTLISDSSSITASNVNTYVSGGSASAGNVTFLADGAIVAGIINTSNSGTSTGGAIALTSGTSTVTVGGADTHVGGGSAAAGNFIVSSPGTLVVTGAINTSNTGTGAGGSVALISGGTISLTTITTAGTPSGSVFLSSAYAGVGGAISTGVITLSGGTLLATAATSGSITVQSYTDGSTLSVNSGQIYATGTYTSAINILLLAFNNSATTTITPAMIPGGGFASFANSGTITLANDAGTSGNVISFSNFIPVFVQGSVTSLGTINDSTGLANFFLLAPTVSVGSTTTYNSTAGSLSIVADTMSLANINTTGTNIYFTSVQAVTIGTINTINSTGTKAGSITLLSALRSVTTGAIATYITSGSVGSGNVNISAYGDINTNQQAINAYNSGTGPGGTINFAITGNGAVKIGQIDTSVKNATSNAAAGNITILAAAAITNNRQTINTYNLGTGAGGTVTLTSPTFSIITGNIDSHATSGSAPAGNVFVSAYEDIDTGNINSSHSGTGMGGAVTLIRAAAMKTGDINTTSAGSVGGAITAVSVGDNSTYTIVMGNLNTSGFTAGGAVMLVGDDFGQRPFTVGTITTNATGPNGIGGSVGLATLGTLTTGAIDTTNTSAVAGSGAQSGSVFISSGKDGSGVISASSIKAYNSANGSATGQVILIASGTITTSGAITTSAGTIAAQTFTSNVVSGTEASVTPSYTNNKLSITSSTTVNVSVTGISGASSNFNPKGYAALNGSNTVLTIDSGGNSLMMAPLIFTAYVPMTIKSINSANSTTADGIAIAIFGNLTLGDAVGINASGTVSGGNVTIQSSAGQISLASINTSSSGTGAAGNINLTAWAAVPITGTINASNTGTGAGGSVLLASTDNSVITGNINTSVTNGSMPSGNVVIMSYQAMTTQVISTNNAGTGAAGTVFLTSSNSSVTPGQIDTYADGGSSGGVYISAYGAINMNGNSIQAYNNGAGNGNGGNVSLISTSNSIVTSTIDSFVTTGSGSAGNVTVCALDNITLGGSINAYNNGTGPGGTITVTAGGDITITGPITVQSPTIMLMSTTGNIGTITNAITTASTGSLSVNAFGKAYISQTGAFTLLNSQTGGDFQLNSSGATTISSLTSLTGSISVTLGNTAGALTIAGGTSLAANNGTVILQTDDVANGSIVLGSNAVVRGTGVSLNSINMVVNGSIQAMTANIDVQSPGGNPLSISMGPGSIFSAVAPGSNVRFNNLSAAPITITGGTANGIIYATDTVNFNGGINPVNVTVHSIYGRITGTGNPFIIITYTAPDSEPVIETPSNNSLLLTANYVSSLATIDRGIPTGTIIPVDTINLVNPVITPPPSTQNTNPSSNDFTPGTITFIGGTTGISSFDSQTISLMQSQGIRVGPNTSGNFLQLQQGYIMVSQNNNQAITIGVNEGFVNIAGGAMAIVMETGNDVAVYSLYSNQNDDITVVADNKVISLRPGRMIVLTRNSKASFDEVNPSKNVATRHHHKHDVGGGIVAYTADFSFVSALNNIGVLKSMLHSSDQAQRQLAAKLIKFAAIQMHMTANAGPFSNHAN